VTSKIVTDKSIINFAPFNNTLQIRPTILDCTQRRVDKGKTRSSKQLICRLWRVLIKKTEVRGSVIDSVCERERERERESETKRDLRIKTIIK